MTKGKVWISAVMKEAYEIQRWKTWSFSWLTPVIAVIKLLLPAVAKMNGKQAMDSQPARVAIGGEFPQWSVSLTGQ